MADATPPDDDYAGWFRKPLEADWAATALVIIDLQVGNSLREGAQGRIARDRGQADALEYRFSRVERSVIPNTQSLLRHCRGAGLATVYVVLGSDAPDYSDMQPRLRDLCRAREMAVGNPDFAVVDAVAPLPGEVVLRKTTQSAFTSTGIEATLRHRGIRQLLVCGVSTDQCVLTTALDAAERGFGVRLVEDCCAATRPEYHQAALQLFGRFAGEVTNSKDLAVAITARA